MINFEKTQLKKIKNPIENTIEKDQKSRKSTQKVQSHGSGRPTQLSRPSWFPLSRGYCFSWRAKQKRHQGLLRKEVGESLRRVFGCHSVSAFRSPTNKSSRQPTNFYQEKNVTFLRCGLGSGGADLALEVRTWEMRKNEKIQSAGPKSADLDVCMYT